MQGMARDGTEPSPLGGRHHQEIHRCGQPAVPDSLPQLSRKSHRAVCLHHNHKVYIAVLSKASPT